MNNKVVIEFEAEKQTKNTIRFAEVTNDLGPAPAVGTLYVQKWALGQLGEGNVPNNLKVTIEVVGVKDA